MEEIHLRSWRAPLDDCFTARGSIGIRSRRKFKLAVPNARLKPLSSAEVGGRPADETPVQGGLPQRGEEPSVRTGGAVERSG
ncbi:hypothetical protein VTN00DRAFT_588 [Thermoascus crustaceus]|uniref:uncharacterized protein n=1 Tax=Thermoascus crustaceus TaxID=5088 RepID=UPI003743460F